MGSRRLRDALEDPQVVKVLHCCYGDASSLFYAYGIQIAGVFDTGLADCMLRGVKSNKQRGLQQVLTHYLGKDNVSLKHKGQLEHVPRMFEPRPLSLQLFEYAYEDVLLCNRLYIAMSEELRERGLLELAFALSALRTPPIALPASHPLHRPPTHVTVVVHDLEYHFTVQKSPDTRAWLPSAPLGGESDDFRVRVTAAWTSLFGDPPRHLAGLLKSRVQKRTRIKDTVLFTLHVGDCRALVAQVQEATSLRNAVDEDRRVVLRRNCNMANPSAGAAAEDVEVFQYIHHMSSSYVTSALVADYETGTHDSKDHLVHTGETNVVVGRVVENRRAALILHDDSHFYCLTSKDGATGCQFPSHAVEIGATPVDAALKAFDNYAGVALRKAARSKNALSVMPRTAALINAAIKDMRVIGNRGNTLYYDVRIANLMDLRASFAAARQSVNGFRLTKTLEKRHPSYLLGKVSDAEAVLHSHDFEALQAALNNSTFSEAEASAAVAAPQEPINMGSDRDEEEEEPLVDGSTVSDGSVLPDLSEGEAAHLPAVGCDPEFDALFEAAVFVHYSRLTTEMDSEGDNSSAAVAAAVPVRLPSIEELRDSQLEHPVTAELLDYLQMGELSQAWEQASLYSTEDSLKEEAAHYFIDHNGILCRTPPSKAKRGVAVNKGLIVVPPKWRASIFAQFHDQLGHFEVHKVYPLIASRFYWPGMRTSLEEHIRSCDVCQRVKLPNRKAGEYQIGENGHHPGDVFAVDIYFVGLTEDGYSHTFDAADYHTRGIRAKALQGVPNSEEVADIIINDIIRDTGIPSEIRCDAGSNLISKAIQEIYKRLRIKITVGTAYHHQLVALVERWHRTLKQLILTVQASRAHGMTAPWWRCLPMLELAFNITVNQSTGYSPFFLKHLRYPRFPTDGVPATPLPNTLPEWVQQRLDELDITYDAAARSLRWNALAAKRRYDLTHNLKTSFKPGERVLLIKGTASDRHAVHPKAEIPTDGPFSVASVLSHDRYVLADLRTRRIRTEVHVSRLKPYQGKVPADDEWMVSTPITGGYWPVHSVVARRFFTLDRADRHLNLEKGTKVLQYKVRWVGFDKSSDKWLSVQYLDNIKGLLNIFDQHHPFPPEFNNTKLCGQSRAPPLLPPPSLQNASGTPLPESPPPSGSAPSEPLAIEPVEDIAKSTEEDLQTSLNRLPVNTRVRVHYPQEGKSWTGTVTKSWIPRWRTEGKQLAHHVVVRYDEHPFKGEEFQHCVADSQIEVIESQDNKTTRRLARLARQLA